MKWYMVDEKNTNEWSVRQNEVKERIINAPRSKKAPSNQPHKVEASDEKKKGAAIRNVSSQSLCYNKV